MRILILLFMFGSLISCGNVATTGDPSSIDPGFFNLVDFVELEKERLANTTIIKTVTVRGISETKTLSDVDWTLELAPFAQSNIDRPAFWDAYSVDTTVSTDGQMVHTYHTLDSSNFTKTIELTWADRNSPIDSIDCITIDNGFNSFLADTRQRLVWCKDHYSISSTQDALLSEKRELMIESEWGRGIR